MATKNLTPIRVGILDDHQIALDSYSFRMAQKPGIEVVATASYGNQLIPMLETYKLDVLVLDINVPNSAHDRNPYPILFLLPKLRKQYPETQVLIISMHEQRELVKNLLEAGASGYILKEDHEAIVHLADVVNLVNIGGVYLSKQLREALAESPDGKLLSNRQREALSLAAAYPDIKTDELSRRLHIAPSTMRNLLSRAYKRLKVSSRSAATEKARKLGLISPFAEEPLVKG